MEDAKIIAMNTIDASRGKWEYIFSFLGLPPKTGGSHYKGPCPLCGKKHHFRFDDRSGDGDWICTCSNGKGLELIQEVFQIDFEEACDRVDSIIGNTRYKSAGPVVPVLNRHERAYFHGTGPKGTMVERYLSSRGIHILPELDCLRFSTMSIYDQGRSFPAMMAKVVSFGNSFSYIHYTYLVDGRKVSVEPDKKIFSIATGAKGACIKLFPADEILGVAEGIETALSATQMYKIPTWSTLNTGFMRKFVAPLGVKKLIVFADNDENLSGAAAAFDCARRNMLAPNDLDQIDIIWPEKIGFDFNDLLRDGNFQSVIVQQFLKPKQYGKRN